MGAGSGRALTDLRLNLSRGTFYDAVDRCSLPCVAMADGVANAGAAVAAAAHGLIALKSPLQKRIGSGSGL